MTSRRQRDAASILVAGFWLTCFTVAAFGEIGPPIGADKKLIGFAINSADAGYLREHVGDVERLPLGGQGPPYPIRLKSLMPCLAPSARSLSGVASS